jgi:hypothetical protein
VSVEAKDDLAIGPRQGDLDVMCPRQDSNLRHPL